MLSVYQVFCKSLYLYHFNHCLRFYFLDQSHHADKFHLGISFNNTHHISILSLHLDRIQFLICSLLTMRDQDKSNQLPNRYKTKDTYLKLCQNYIHMNLNTFIFLFSNIMLVIRAGIHKLLARIWTDMGLRFVCKNSPSTQLPNLYKTRDTYPTSINALKFEHFYLSILKYNAGYQDWNSQIACQNSNCLLE